MRYEQVIPSIRSSWQAPVHTIVMLLFASCGGMGICSKLVHLHPGYLQNMEIRAFQGLVQVLVHEACLHICPIVLQREELFNLKDNTGTYNLGGIGKNTTLQTPSSRKDMITYGEKPIRGMNVIGEKFPSNQLMWSFVDHKEKIQMGMNLSNF